MSDSELELIRRKKLMEMKKRLEKGVDATKSKDEQKNDENKVLRRFLIGRGWEVLEAARFQHPQAAKGIEKTLVKLISEGKIRNKISGQELYGLFHRLGLRVRLKTRIRVLEHGKLKDFEEKIKERISEWG